MYAISEGVSCLTDYVLNISTTKSFFGFLKGLNSLSKTFENVKYKLWPKEFALGTKGRHIYWRLAR